MAGNVHKLKPWVPGQSGNPSGRPLGARNKLQHDFLAVLAADFAEHGEAAVIQMREEKPGDYIRVVASLMPKEIDLGRKLSELTDDEIAHGIAALQQLVTDSLPAVVEGETLSKTVRPE